MAGSTPDSVERRIFARTDLLAQLRHHVAKSRKHGTAEHLKADVDTAWYSRVLRRSTLSNVLTGVKTFEMVTVILSSLDGPRKDRSVGWSECVHQRAFLDMGNHDQNT